jgi:hypothetical protein
MNERDRVTSIAAGLIGSREITEITRKHRDSGTATGSLRVSPR